MDVPQEVGQPPVGPGIALVHTIRVDTLDVPEPVDVLAPRIHDADRRRTLLEHADEPGEHRPREVVVVRDPLEELTARELEGAVVIGGQADIGLVPDVANAPIPLCKPAADVFGPIGRCIVRDDQLEVSEVLLDQPRQGIGQVLLAVVDGQADAHLGPTHPSVPRSSFAGEIRTAIFGSGASKGAPLR